MSADGIPEETEEEAKGKAEELAWSLPLGQMTKAVLCGKELPLWGEVLGLRTIMLTWFWSEKAEASIVLGICPCCYDKITHKSNLRMGLFWLTVLGIKIHHCTKTCRQEHETTGHTVSAVGKQRKINTAPQLASFFFFFLVNLRVF